MAADKSASVAVFSLDGEMLFATPCRIAATTSRFARSRPTSSSSRAGPAIGRPLSTAVRARSSRVVTSPNGRHFYGHGVFTPDGNLLYATENLDRHAAKACWASMTRKQATAASARCRASESARHDIALLPDRHRMVVANGGIRTNPRPVEKS